MNILSVKNYSFAYKGSQKNAVEDINFSVNEGELILLCGGTASGKTTLLRSLKPELSPYGKKNGNILFMGEDLCNISAERSASEIGYVMQRPENQLVAHNVWHELAFNCENLGMKKEQILRNIAEISGFFGLDSLLDCECSTLSGGQKQIVNLAAVMAVKPKLLLLDEPTSQLDPVTANDFIRTLHRITRELSITVIVSEHRFEQLFPLTDKILFIENGRQISFDTPQNSIEYISNSKSLCSSMPSYVTLYNTLMKDTDISAPVSLSDGRILIEKNINKDIKCLKKAKQSVSSDYAVEFKDVFFTYESLKADILKGIDLNVKKGEILSVLGSNGSGKSTLLSIAAGLNKAYSGKIEIDGQNIKKLLRNKGLYKKTAMLTQDIQTSFLTDVVCEELDGELLTPVYDFTPFKNMHPYDLSGGQQQLLGLAKLLKKNPEILLLDEPTKGLDGHWKMIISETLLKLKESGITILMVTHDTELAAVCSDRCVLLFNGRTLEPQSPSDLFCGGLYYTTSAAKVSDGFFDKICTTKQLIEICRLNGLCMEGEK